MSLFDQKRESIQDMNDQEIADICRLVLYNKFKSKSFLEGKYVKLTIEQIALKLKNEYKKIGCDCLDPSFARPKYFHFSEICYRQANANLIDFVFPEEHNELLYKIVKAAIESNPEIFDQNIDLDMVIELSKYDSEWRKEGIMATAEDSAETHTQ